MPTTAMATGVGFAPESEALSAGEEAAASDLLGRLKHRLDTRRIELASWFMDFSASQNSPMRVNHVTPPQFRQVLAKLELVRHTTRDSLVVLGVLHTVRCRFLWTHRMRVFFSGGDGAGGAAAGEEVRRERQDGQRRRLHQLQDLLHRPPAAAAAHQPMEDGRSLEQRLS